MNEILESFMANFLEVDNDINSNHAAFSSIYC